MKRLLLMLIVFFISNPCFGEWKFIVRDKKIGITGNNYINTKNIDMFTFAFGSGVAGVAGVALSQITNVGPNLGQNYIIDSFMVVVFGGVGNLFGTFIGAFGLGLGNKLMEPYVGAIVSKIFILLFIIIFIQFRPKGLFSLKGRMADE